MVESWTAPFVTLHHSSSRRLWGEFLLDLSTMHNFLLLGHRTVANLVHVGISEAHHDDASALLEKTESHTHLPARYTDRKQYEPECWLPFIWSSFIFTFIQLSLITFFHLKESFVLNVLM